MFFVYQKLLIVISIPSCPAGIYLAQRLNPEKRLEYVEAIRNIAADEDNESVSSIEEEPST